LFSYIPNQYLTKPKVEGLINSCNSQNDYEAYISLGSSVFLTEQLTTLPLQCKSTTNFPSNAKFLPNIFTIIQPDRKSTMTSANRTYIDPPSQQTRLQKYKYFSVHNRDTHIHYPISRAQKSKDLSVRASNSSHRPFRYPTLQKYETLVFHSQDWLGMGGCGDVMFDSRPTRYVSFYFGQAFESCTPVDGTYSRVYLLLLMPPVSIFLAP
jgi:hypothetical protein